ncbi:MAG: hypothetical protein KDA37_06930, partial [Planctomycetales bacterium]|nr:hypothetical protein [Planctomycetales bacterium]
AVVMRPGAAVAYRGCELSHWREPAPPGSYRQVFLHYVEEGGPYAGLRNDGREALGTASVRGPADHDEQAGHTPPTPGVA